MTGYLRPVDAPISASWQDHRNRTPPSQEPGTDYACAYGTTILAAGAGRIADAKTSNGSATGRYITLDLDDGRRVRYLHLDYLLSGVGDRVERGWAIAISGASGNGSDWWYGPHVHTTLFPSHSNDFARTLDFEAYVGEDPEPEPPPPPPPRRKLKMIHAAWIDPAGAVAIQYQPRGKVTLITDPTHWMGIQAATGAEAHPVGSLEGITGMFGTLPYAAADMEHGTGMTLVHERGGAGGLYLLAGGTLTRCVNPTDTLEYLEGRVPQVSLTPEEIAALRGPDPDAEHPPATASLAGAAWVGGVALGLIGLVEVVRFLWGVFP